MKEQGCNGKRPVHHIHVRPSRRSYATNFIYAAALVRVAMNPLEVSLSGEASTENSLNDLVCHERQGDELSNVVGQREKGKAKAGSLA